MNLSLRVTSPIVIKTESDSKQIQPASPALVWCAGKNLTIETESGQHNMPVGTFVLIPSGKSLTVVSGERGCAYAVIEFDVSREADIPFLLYSNALKTFPDEITAIPSDSETAALFMLVCRAITADRSSASAMFLALLAQLLGQQRDVMPSETFNSYQYKLVESVKRIVSSNYADKVTLESVASELYVNASYLSTLFKRKTGLSFRQYLCRFRIAKAQEILLQTSDLVEDIATMTGFGSTAYFISVFREQCGITPNVFRSQARRREILK